MRLAAFIPLLFSLIIAALPTGESPGSCGRILLLDPVWGTQPAAANLTTDWQCHHWEYEDYTSWVYYIDAHCLCSFHKYVNLLHPVLCIPRRKTLTLGQEGGLLGYLQNHQNGRCQRYLGRGFFD